MFASRLKITGLMAALVMMLAAAPAMAERLAAPSGPVILSLSGNIASSNGEGRADFDLAMLEQLPQTELNTSTPWTEGPQRFRGVLLRDLLAAVGANGDVIVATALNDYAIEIPTSDAGRTDVLLAFRHNDKLMRVRNKGPIWVIYPDTSADDNIRDRMIWQLRSMEIK